MSQCMFISQSATYPRHKSHFNSHQLLPLLALLLHPHLGMTVQKYSNLAHLNKSIPVLQKGKTPGVF